MSASPLNEMGGSTGVLEMFFLVLTQEGGWGETPAHETIIKPNASQ